MKRIRFWTAVLGMCLLLVSTAHAQTGFIPVFIDDSGTEDSSNIFQDPNGLIVIDIAMPVGPLLTVHQGSMSTGPALRVSSNAAVGEAIHAECAPTTDCNGLNANGWYGVRTDGRFAGVVATGGIGVQATGNPGVLAFTSTPGGLAGRFNGDVVITGTLTKGGGMFKIDHPLDPANKYLSHSFVESPDMMNIYNGIVVLDNKGEAWVNMPDWFAGLNRDFRYQLTAIGAPAPKLYIAKEISGNRFKIAGGKSRGKVSWQVTGIRQDAYANAHRITVEEDKPREEQGYYLHPELFGQPAAKSINAVRTPAPVTVHGASNDREVASHR